MPAAACYTRPSVKAAQQQLLGGSRTSRAGHAPPVGSCWCRQDQARGRTGYPISLALYQVLPVPASFFGAPACARVPPAPAFLLPCLPAASCPHSSALSARLFTSLFLAQTAVAFHAFCSTLTSHHPTFPHFSFSSGFSQFRCPLPTAPILRPACAWQTVSPQSWPCFPALSLLPAAGDGPCAPPGVGSSQPTSPSPSFCQGHPEAEEMLVLAQRQGKEHVM